MTKDRAARWPPEGFALASEVGMTLTGTFTFGGVTYREPVVHLASGRVIWPGEAGFPYRDSAEER